MLFTIFRFLKNVRGLIRSCLFCQQVIAMFVLLSAAWAAGALYARWWCGIPDWGAWSFAHLFDLDEAIQAIHAASGFGKVVSVLLYSVTWLLGGGILLSVVVDRSTSFWSRVREGHMRYRSFLADHLVVLGWESNTVTLLKDVAGAQTVGLFSFVGLYKRPRIVILSQSEAVAIKDQIQKSFGASAMRRLPFKLIVYNGNFDSETEFPFLAIHKAKKVYVTGEGDPQSHDSRVLVLLADLDAYIQKQRGFRQLMCHVRIANYALFRNLILNINKRQDQVPHQFKALKVRFFNFYENWAKKILPPEGIPADYPSLLPSYSNVADRPPIRLIVIGFRKMGQAVAVEAMRTSAKYCGAVTNISVVDKDISTLRNSFELSHGDLMKYEYAKTSTLQYEDPMSVDSDAFKSLVSKCLKSGERMTVIITLSDPDRAVAAAIAINSMASGAAQIFTRLDVDVANAENCRRRLEACYNLKHIFFYGFRDGAGFGKYSSDTKEN